MIDFGLNPQQALDAPRWQWIGGKTVEVEQDTPNHIIRQLQRMGHNVVVQPDPYHMGRGQIIIRDEDGVLCGATEKRTDGQIACFLFNSSLIKNYFPGIAYLRDIGDFCNDEEVKLADICGKRSLSLNFATFL